MIASGPRGVAAAVLAACGLGVAAVAPAQPFPSRPLRIVVPFAPGGNIDITARNIAPGLSEALGQPVVVENRGGAGGRIGNEIVARGQPDGHTLLLGSSGAMTMTPVFFRKVPYDPLRDFATTSMVSIVPLVLTVHPGVAAKSVGELLALARSRPGKLTMASAGTGSTTHLTGELFQVVTGTKITHVPYKGSGPALVDLIGGQVDLIFDQISTSGAHIRAGRLRALAVAHSGRAAALPDVPTMAEAGLKGLEASTWTGIMLPAATPRDIVVRVHGALLRVLDTPSTRENFERLGAEVLRTSPEEFTRKLRDDLERWRRVQKATGLLLD